MLVSFALNNAEGSMSVEQSIKPKTSHAITSKNKAVVMLDHPENRSNAFDLFEFCHTLPIPIAINTSQWNCCLGNMANFNHLMVETDVRISSG